MEINEHHKRTNRKFSREEDLKLKELVKKYGEHAWEEVSFRMNGRNVRQCKDRWMYYLSPKVSNEPWTDEEDARLMNLVDLMGHRWVAISHHMTGRSANNIKNHWHKELSKRKLETDGLQAPLRQMSCDIPSTMSHAFDLFEAMSDGSASDLDFAATGYSHKQ